ncbi:gamma-interferon-inducible lysosomal thiol reductase-like [Elysia marginata]|uniref:Gamma-interferon-inducible lysosomal thiol reductase-like n=1 Tax=Elysia marginata TaxID=1093978 RepID=A0AAV4GX66_9GAST|nr:gamma-interferon-inducible lysosomal thiol reductase-like [Elysia marginata]
MFFCLKEKKVGDKWEFQCQHGEQECIGNLIETCTIALVKDIKKYFPFINCMEVHTSTLDPEAAAKKVRPHTEQTLNEYDHNNHSLLMTLVSFFSLKISQGQSTVDST